MNVTVLMIEPEKIGQNMRKGQQNIYFLRDSVNGKKRENVQLMGKTVILIATTECSRKLYSVNENICIHDVETYFNNKELYQISESDALKFQRVANRKGML